MDQHVIAPLQKAGVHRKHREHALFGHARRHGDGMALGNAHIEEPVRGNSWAKSSRPVPSAMAAVMAQMRPSSRGAGGSASLPNTEEKSLRRSSCTRLPVSGLEVARRRGTRPGFRSARE